MNNFPNKKDRIIILALWFVFFVTAVSFGLFLLAFQDIGTIITAILSSTGTIFLTIMIKKVSKGYFLKYYFNKKNYKLLLNESIKKFPNADEAFIKEFKRRTLFQYYTTGKIFYYPTIEDDKWLLSDKDNLKGLKILIELLLKSITDKSGFTWFIENAFKITHNGELIMQTLENEFLSGEIRYLFFMVFILTGFNIEDNGLSIEYTNNINKIKDELDKRYTPLLLNFKEELENVKYTLTKDDNVIVS